VIGINVISHFLAVGKEADEVGLDDFLNHVEYVAKLVGVNNVGIGLDYRDGIITKEEVEEVTRLYPEIYPKHMKGGVHFSKIFYPWLDSLSKMPMITEGLVSRGYSDNEILKILGGNFLRVFKRVWKS